MKPIATCAQWLEALTALRRKLLPRRLRDIAADLQLDLNALERRLAEHPQERLACDELIPCAEPYDYRRTGWRLLAAMLSQKLPDFAPQHQFVAGDLRITSAAQRTVLGDLHVAGNLVVQGELLVFGALSVQGFHYDSRRELAEIVVAGDVHCGAGLVTEGFFAIGGKLSTPYAHLSFNKGFTKILDGCEVRVLLENEHIGSRIFGSTRIAVCLSDALELNDSGELPDSAPHDVLPLLPPRLREQAAALPPRELGDFLSAELLTREGAALLA